jgi:hypothetical protein
MPDRVPTAHARSPRRTGASDPPPPEIVDFIRFCHRRRGVGWPEIYDEMCAVASRREFNGWDHADLSQRGVTFSLLDTPRLAAWVRAVLAPAEVPQRNARPV